MTAKAQNGQGGEHRQERGPWKLSVDTKPFSSDQPVLTGAQIKALAQADPTAGLFLESHGHEPNQQIADGQSVDLRSPGREHFFTAPGATFGLGEGKPLPDRGREVA
jgi:hypothetical protein